MPDSNNHFQVDLSSQANLTKRNGQFYLSGHLNYANVNDVYKVSLGIFKGEEKVVVDFSQLDSSNSASVALLVEWIKLAKKQNISIRFQAIPDRTLSIIKSAGMSSIVTEFI